VRIVQRYCKDDVFHAAVCGHQLSCGVVSGCMMSSLDPVI
jgi:hypothetical protein